MTIFRAYDIRGVYPTEVNEELAEQLGKGFGSFLPENATVAVCGDVRASTPSLKKAIIKGLVSTGAPSRTLPDKDKCPHRGSGMSR